MLGLVFNAAPGPLFAETVRQAARAGFHPALQVQFGSMVGDALWAVLGLFGVGALLQIEVLRLPVAIAGAAYLFWLAWESWRDGNPELAVTADPAHASGAAFRSGVTLSLTNPQNVAYWAALGSVMTSVGVAHPTLPHYLVFFGGFMLASLIWAYLCAGLVTQIFLRGNGRWTRAAYRLCAAGFATLGLLSLRNLWREFSLR